MKISAGATGRLFAIVCAGNRIGAAIDAIAAWFAAAGVAALVLDARAGARGCRRLAEVLPHLERLEPAALRGYLAARGAGFGRVAIADQQIESRELARLSQAYAILVLVAEGAGGIPRAFAEVPALVLASPEEEGSLAAAGDAIEQLLAAPQAPRPAAFAIAPHDAAIAARLARRWRLATWGDAAGAGCIAERILERAVPLEAPVPCPDAAPDVAAQILTQLRCGKTLEGLLRAPVGSELDAAGRETLLRDRVAAEARRLVAALPESAIAAAAPEEVVARVVDASVGAGPLAPFIADPAVTEIMVVGTRPLFIERCGRIEPTAARFVDHAQLMAVIERLLLPTGRRLDEASPAVDARLPDGSRLHAIIPPLAIDGPALTIRRFAAGPKGLAGLVDAGMLPRGIAALLAACVQGRVSIVISGGTGAGKTTLLAAIASEIDLCERVITIEDAAELRLALPHVVRLEARPANIEGAGAVTIRELVRHALRMRPDRIVVGECRGPEALDMLSAMNTGHEGSLTTVHANSPRDATARLETMALMAGLELPLAAVREQVARAIDLIVQVARVPGGGRRVIEIAELTGMEGPVVTIQTLAQMNAVGVLEATGLRPRFADRLAARGVELPTRWGTDPDPIHTESEE